MEPSRDPAPVVLEVLEPEKMRSQGRGTLRPYAQAAAVAVTVATHELPRERCVCVLLGKHLVWEWRRRAENDANSQEGNEE